MLHAAPLGVGNREEHARVVGFLDDAGSGSYRQTAVLLNLVYHFHRLAPPSIRYPLHSRRLHCASLAIRKLHTVYPLSRHPPDTHRCDPPFPADNPLHGTRQGTLATGPGGCLTRPHTQGLSQPLVVLSEEVFPRAGDDRLSTAQVGLASSEESSSF